MTGQAAGRCSGQSVRSATGGIRQDTDLVCRYGGEEFAIVFPGTDEARAATVAERARQAVAGLAQPHGNTPAGIVTVSVGVAARVPTLDLAAESVVKAADIALYQAKQDGRNRVHTAGPHDASARLTGAGGGQSSARNYERRSR